MGGRIRLEESKNIPNMVREATSGMNSLQLGRFREELAKELPKLIKTAAEKAKDKEQKP